MSEHETLIRRLIDEIINHGNLAAADELLGADFVSHGPMGPMRGIEAFKQMVEMWRAAVPNVHCRVENYFESGDMSTWVVRLERTHTGEMMGIPPTGGSFEYTTPNIGRWAAGRPAEHWADQGMFQFLTQIGVLAGA